MKSEVYRTLVLTKRKPISPGHSRTPPWGILALCTVKYKTSMMRNTNGGQCVCLNIIKIRRVSMLHVRFTRIHSFLLVYQPYMSCLTTLFGYLGHAQASCWLHYVYITMLYMNACMPRICRISVLYLLETWTQMKTYAPHTCQQILRRLFGVVRSLTMQARGCGGGLYWKMHGRCGCPWSRYGEYPRLIVMSVAYKAHHLYPGYTGAICVGYHGQFCVITIQ